MFRTLLIAVAGLMLVASVVLWILLLLPGGDRLRPPEELERVALGGGSEAEKEQAALDLARWGQRGREHMRRVLQTSDLPGVKAAVVEGLGELPDSESMPTFIELLNHPDLNLRGRAGIAVSKVLGSDVANYGYRLTDDPAKRNRAIHDIKAAFEKHRKTPDS